MADVRSVDERLAATQIDLTRAHELFLAGMRVLADKVRAAFSVERHPACEPYLDFRSPNGAMRGSVSAWTGADIDWMIDSWIGSPERGFTNHHITIYLPPTIPVPHLGFACGTIPDIFCFADLVPRTDLWVDTDELDRYHARFNDRAVAIAADPRFSPFISKEIYIRQAASPVAVCETCEVSEDNIAFIMSMFEETLDQWITWVKEAEATPAADRVALAARDRRVRENICHRDPANIVAEKVLGADMTNQLVRLLSAEVRDEQ